MNGENKMKKKTKRKNVKKYVDGGKMKLSENLSESRKSMASSKKKGLKNTMARKNTRTLKKMVATGSKIDEESTMPIVFNSEMRKTFIKGVIQDIKGYFESKTSGKVEISYEDINLGNHEFGFKLTISKGKDCTKQMFSEVSSAACNVVNYMIPADEFDRFDLTTTTENNRVEFEIVSNW